MAPHTSPISIWGSLPPVSGLYIGFSYKKGDLIAQIKYTPSKIFSKKNLETRPPFLSEPKKSNKNFWDFFLNLPLCNDYIFWGLLNLLDIYLDCCFLSLKRGNNRLKFHSIYLCFGILLFITLLG